VLEQYAAGFRSIKPYTWLSREVYLAVAETAKSQGMYIVGHIPYSVGVDGAVAANQDEIAHIHSFHQDFFVDFDPNEVFREYELDLSRTLPIAAKLRDAGVRVTTTLIVNQALADAQDLDVYLERPMQDFEFSWARPYMDSPSWRFNKLWKRHYLEQEYLPWIYALLKTFNDFGVMLVLGTDSGVTGLVHGFSTHEELKLLVKAGLSPYEALRTATFNAARIANEESRWGTIETGKVADLVLLKENPLDDIANSRSIAGVVKSGRWFDEATLNSLKEQIRVAVN
jgi:imidazolonepropionase-like amidohydrolase